jgi:hypothetical protein
MYHNQKKFTTEKERMNNIDPIQEELAQAGEASPITPSLLQLDSCRIMTDTEVPKEEFLFRMYGKPCFPCRDISTVTGMEKCGKTIFTSMLMACTYEERLELLITGIQTYKPDMVIIDNISDLLPSVNDSEQSSKIIEQLMVLSTEYDCNITVVIHLNRSGEKRNDYRQERSYCSHPHPFLTPSLYSPHLLSLKRGGGIVRGV